MLRVGLTGGIGSGKSTVTRIFECLRIPVYYADDAAKRLVETDDDLRTRIVRLLGPEAYRNGRYNRPAVAAAVFGNKALLDELNGIVHPAVGFDGERWIAALPSTTPYAVKEAALLFESGSAARLDFLVGVRAPTTLRMQRAAQRDGLSNAAVEARMARQMDEEEKLRRCDVIILNDDRTALLPQVLRLHEMLLQRAASR